MNVHPNIERAAQACGQRIDKFLRITSDDLMGRLIGFEPWKDPELRERLKLSPPSMDGMPVSYAKDDPTAAPVGLPSGFAFHVDFNTGTGTPTGLTGATDSINGWAIDTFLPTIGSGGFKVGLDGPVGAKYAVAYFHAVSALSFFTTSTKASFQSGFVFANDWTQTVRAYVGDGNSTNYGFNGVGNKNPASSAIVYHVAAGANVQGRHRYVSGNNLSLVNVLTSGTWVTIILKWNGTAVGTNKPFSVFLNGSPTAAGSGTSSTGGAGGQPGFVVRNQLATNTIAPRIGAGGIFNGLMTNQQMLDTHNYYASIWNSTTAP
jgi:hypothetical protein